MLQIITKTIVIPYPFKGKSDTHRYKFKAYSSEMEIVFLMISPQITPLELNLTP